MTALETLAYRQALEWHLADKATQAALERSIDDGWAEGPKTDQSACRAKQSN